MTNRFCRFLAVLAVVQVVGGQWLALQSAAWVGMFAKFSRQDSIVVALGKTFDGKHPCTFCSAVERGREEEKKQQSEWVTIKLEAVLARVVRVPRPTPDSVSYELLEQRAVRNSQRPMLRPPRATA